MEEVELPFDLEREKLKVEREKLEVERGKLAVERKKLKYGTQPLVFTLVGTLVAAVIAAFATIWNQHKQAQTQFEIEATEIVLKTESPSQAKATAAALAQLFPGRLPKDFGDKFDPDLGFGPDITGAKVELLRLLPNKPASEQEAIKALWKQLFWEDTTFQPIETKK